MTALARGSQEPSVVPLARLEPGALDSLFAAERREWLSRLEWDLSEVNDLVSAAIRARVVRGVALGGELASTTLADVMSGHVRCAREEDNVDQVLSEMAEAQIRRLPVVDARQRLVGIVSLGDIAAKVGSTDDTEVASSLGDISSPAEPDRT